MDREKERERVEKNITYKEKKVGESCLHKGQDARVVYVLGRNGSKKQKA